jgi:hypothetical protein
MMTLVITFFAIPIGILLLLNERRTAHIYQGIFDDFLEEVKADERLDDVEKLHKLRSMLEHNHYHITSRSSNQIEAEKKLFSMGLLSIGTGFMYIGAAVYIFYYYKVQKPHKVKFHL